ncbi:MAG TPA: CTP synthase, partial [bacterium]|nr:CTP synthase [bacterium]
MTRYIFVAGGVMSGIGKGTTMASVSLILKSKGFSVAPMKIDPYLNVDAGTMNPIEHGEVFVTKDGIETDQDIGIYERFIDEELTKENYMTSGQVYLSVIQKERNFEFEGKCVEVIPHITNEIIWRIKNLGRVKKADFVLVEIGGTVGEYQNLLFLEAARQMKLATPRRVLFILVSYLPIPAMLGEMKTKPTQTAARLLNEAGIQPNFIVARARVPLDKPRRKKIALFCNLREENVISAPDVKFLYEIPFNFEKENFGNKILKEFKMIPKKSNLKK